MARPEFARRGRSLLPGQRSELTVVNADGTGRRVVLVADEIVEAPNWTPDGRWLIFNAGGELWRIAPDGSGAPERIDTGTLRDLNNDHILSPDGRILYVSSDDSHLYALPAEGGTPRRISNTHPSRHHYYLHGVSPDGATLIYVAIESGPSGERLSNIWSIPAAGGPNTRLTDLTAANDGPEYSPDGAAIWFNSEANSPGQAQIYRMRPDGSELTQVTFDERVNWFPHFSPDGSQVAYLSYPPGTEGHPANKEVVLRIMRPDATGTRDIAAFLGGQGTINVNSWAPDSRQLAFVAYPMR